MRKEATNKMFFFFFVVNFLSLCFGDLTYDVATCSNSSISNTYNVFQNTILYFRSPDFPKTMLNGSTSNPIVCNAKFQAKEANSQLWFIMYNGMVPKFILSDSSGYQEDFYDFDSYSEFVNFFPKSNIFQFQFGDRSSTDWVAYEAAVLSLSTSTMDVCPFGNQTIKLEENKIIPITTLIGDYQYFNCTWKFSITSNQSLKLVVKLLKTFTYGDLLQIKTDGTVLDTFTDAPNSVYPIVKNYGSQSGVFELKFNGIYGHGTTNLFAFVSSVIKINTYPDNQCNSLTATTDFVTVTNIDLNNGYTSFDQCFYTVNIPAGYEILVYALNFWIENNADTVILEKGLNQVAVNDRDNHLLTTSANGTIVQFQSDGNIQGAGFSLMLQSLKCECAPSEIIIPCNGTIGITALSNTEYYCSNLQCNFHIKQNTACSSNYFSIYSLYSINLNEKDYISLFVNNILLDNVTSFETFVMSPTDNVTLSFYSQSQSVPIYGGGSWKIYAKHSQTPNFLSPLFLNSTSPSHILWLPDMDGNDAYTVCINGNDTLELFVSDTYYLEYYSLYDSKIMESFVGTLDSPKIVSDNYIVPQHISSSSSCFTIYKTSDSYEAYGAVFFRMKNEDMKNCLSENVFTAEENGNDLSMEANSTGYCKTTILARTYGYHKNSSPIISLSDITVSSNETYTLSSAINQKKYLDFDENTNLDVLKIYTPALNVIIPPSNSISLTAAYSRSSTLTVSGKTDGIFASPSYGGYKESLNSTVAAYLINTQYDNLYTMNLKVASLDVNSTVVISSDYNNSNLTLTTNSNLSINGTEFTLYYNEKYPKSSGFLINYSIGPIIKPISTVTPTSTTPSTTTLAPSTINVTLSNDKLYHVFWLDDLMYNQALTVCSGDDLELFVSYGDFLFCYDLYDSSSQYNYVGSLDSNNLTTPREGVIPRSIMSTSKCFTVVNIVYGSQPSTTLLFRMKQKQSQNCSGVANVFQTPKYPKPPITFSVSPTNGKTCEVIVLNSQTAIDILSINAQDDTAYINVQSSVNHRKLFETNAKDSAVWKNVVIYAAAISLKVFGNADFNISSNQVGLIRGSGYQKGIFVSPRYTGFPTFPYYSLYQSNYFVEKTLTFKVIELLKDSDVYLKIDNKTYDFSKNASFKVLSENFQLYFNKDEGFLIQYTLNEALNITLDSYSSPSYVLWLDNLNPYQAMTICASHIDKLELFVGSNVDFSKYQLYDSQSFNNIIKNFFKNMTSSSGCFTLYNNGNTQATSATLLFRLSKAQSSHCTTSNVFSLDTASPTFTSSSDSSGSCEMIILSSNLPWPNINIQTIDFSSQNNIALMSTINQKTIVNISASEIGLWQNFHINTPALSVIIPPSTTVTLKVNSTGGIPIIIDKCVGGQKGIMVSPSYNGFQQTSNSSFWFYNFQCSNVGINFYVNDIRSNSQVFIQDNNSNKTFDSYGGMTRTSSGNVDIFYTEIPTNANNAGFLITYIFVDQSTVIPTTPTNRAPKPNQTFFYALTIILGFYLTKFFF